MGTLLIVSGHGGQVGEVSMSNPIRAHYHQALKHVGRERWFMHARLEGVSQNVEGMKQWFTHIGWRLQQTSCSSRNVPFEKG